MTLIKHELKSNFKALLIWSTSIGILILFCMVVYPLMEESLSQMDEMYRDMAGLSAALGLDKLSMYTPLGYYGSQVGIILSLGGALYTAILGTGMLSKEEAGHTAEFLLTTPNSRAYVIFRKLGAMALIVLLFEMICFLVAILSFVAIGEAVTMPDLFLYHLAQFILHFEIACICFGISAFYKKTNVGLGLGVATILYFTDIMIKTIKDLEVLKYVTPFYYAGAADIFVNGSLDSLLVFLGIVVSGISIAIAYVKYSSKDIA